VAARMIGCINDPRDRTDARPYRLASPRNQRRNGHPIRFGGRQQSVVFAFRHSPGIHHRRPTIYPRVSNERALYRVGAVDGKLLDRQTE